MQSTTTRSQLCSASMRGALPFASTLPSSSWLTITHPRSRNLFTNYRGFAGAWDAHQHKQPHTSYSTATPTNPRPATAHRNRTPTEPTSSAGPIRGTQYFLNFILAQASTAFMHASSCAQHPTTLALRLGPLSCVARLSLALFRSVLDDCVADW